jgi:Domain of unknown function (DUF4450)
MPAPLYTPTIEAIVCENGARFFNKPLYGANLPSVVLSGDRPCLRLAYGQAVCGDLMLAVKRGERVLWLHDLDDCQTMFKPNLTSWQLSDSRLEGLELRLEAMPWVAGAGFAVRLEVIGSQPEDELIWVYGGMQAKVESNLLWRLDPNEHPELTEQGFDANACKENVFSMFETHFAVLHPQGEPSGVVGFFPAGSALSLVDATHWTDPLTLETAMPLDSPEHPLLAGQRTIPPEALYWSIGQPSSEHPNRNPRVDFEAGRDRAGRQAQTVVCRTPDAFLDRVMDASNASMDAMFYPPTFVHGGMSWNVPYLGWRIRYGPTAYGYSSRVTTEAKHILPHQVLDSSLRDFEAESERLRCLQSQQSRFYGAGHVSIYTDFYNMQEVYFDQLIHAWRWTADAELEALLLPALELHLDWQRECFDADDDGVYESYLNVWASDSIWYNGGGTAQASAYAYAGYLAAADLCERADLPERAAAHRARAERIRTGVLESLWVAERGHLAEYRDALGLKRRHDSACLYTIFLPIDAGMLSPLEALQNLHYTEWGLERTAVTGGELCWTSNFVPYEWSVREVDFADTLHLALAYYQSGRGRDAYKLLAGVVHESAFAGCSPGTMNIAPHVPNRGLEWFRQGRATDFADTVSLFGRTVIEGLFGVRPDYPNGVVHCAPQFPDDWDSARVTTPEFTLEFSRSDGECVGHLDLARPARVVWTLPVLCQRILEVTLDGQPVSYTLEAGYGHTGLKLETAQVVSSSTLRLRFEGHWAALTAIELEGGPGDVADMSWWDATLTALEDPQGCLIGLETGTTGFSATFGPHSGRHLVLARLERDGMPRYQPLDIRILSAPRVEANNLTSPPDWQPLEIDAMFNADLRGIYQETYQSPRPQTCSAQLGTDGFSPWTYTFWNLKPPTLEFGDLNIDDAGWLWTDAGVPFAWSGGTPNACLTSRWDNFPTRVDLELRAVGTQLYALIAGTSNPMQVGLPNAALHLRYDDGSEDTLELIHPQNYLSLTGLYDWELDRFALPNPPPAQVRLGEHVRAVVVTCPLKADRELVRVSLECLSQEVVVGLLGITVSR